MSYFYKIKELTTGKYYVGCQYAQGTSSQNLGQTYFTSCKYIKNKSWTEFIVCYTIDMDDARKYERRYLKKCLSILGRDRFLEVMINRNVAPGILNTPDTIQKANIKRRISNRIAAHKRLENGTHNFLFKRHVPTIDERARSSERMKGNTYGSLICRDEQYRQKQADNSKGNTNVKGKKWWNNGEKRKRSFDCPGQGWVRGSRTKI